MAAADWIEITPDFLGSKMAAKELKAFREKALAEGQSDPLPEHTERVVDEVRGYVRNAYSLEPGAKIPKKLLDAALAILRFRLLTRFPISSLSTEDRRTEYKDAVRLLERVSKGEFRIDEAENPDPEDEAFPGAFGGATKFKMRTDSNS